MNPGPRGGAFELARLRASEWIRFLEHYESIGSTNDRARELACEGLLDLPALIVAERQTAGRGRGANRWWSDEGSLAFSLLLAPELMGIERRRTPVMALAAGVAVVDVVARLVPGRRVGLHWPNDVYLEGRKVCGILAEGLADGCAIVGIGLNLNSSLADAPDDVRRRAVSLAEVAGTRFDRTDTLLSIVGELARSFAALANAPEELGKRFDRLCLQHGERLTLRVADAEHQGICAGVAPDGALLLDTRCGRRAFHSGTLL